MTMAVFELCFGPLIAWAGTMMFVPSHLTVPEQWSTPSSSCRRALESN
jgi:hypothetical protein